MKPPIQTGADFHRYDSMTLPRRVTLRTARSPPVTSLINNSLARCAELPHASDRVNLDCLGIVSKAACAS